VQERIELGRDDFAQLAEAVEQRARGLRAPEAEAGRDPLEVAVVRRQQVALLVVEVLDAVLDAAQERVGLGESRGPSASSGCASRGTGRRARPAAAGR